MTATVWHVEFKDYVPGSLKKVDRSKDFKTKKAAEAYAKKMWAQCEDKARSFYNVVQMPAPPKYKMGDKVYNWQSPDRPATVAWVQRSTEPGFDHTYLLNIKMADGSTKRSKYTNESSLSRTKKGLKK